MTFAWTACALLALSALACSIPGAFLVLSRNSMLSDGLGHAALPGIAAGFLVTHSLEGSVFFAALACAGATTAALYLQRFLRSDAALGLVYPALFAAGVIMVSLGSRGRSLDPETVLVGDPNLLALSSPHLVWALVGIGGLNAAAYAFLLPRLSAWAIVLDQRTARDRAQTRALVAHVALCSLTAACAFKTIGTFGVIAFMVLPAMLARLLCQRVHTLLPVAAAVAAGGALAGFWASYLFDVPPTAGSTLLLALLTVVVTVVGKAAWHNSPHDLHGNRERLVGRRPPAHLGKRLRTGGGGNGRGGIG